METTQTRSPSNLPAQNRYHAAVGSYRTNSAVGLLLGLCVVVGCGSTKVIIKTVTEPNGPTQTGAGSSANAITHCRLVQTAPLCHYARQTVRHAQRQETLNLKTLSAKLIGVRAAHSLSHGSNHTSTARGEYLIITLNITNNLTSRETFARAGAIQTILVAGAHYHGEAFNAEKTDPNSFITRNGPIEPRASEAADIIFDVPRVAATTVMNETDGGLFIGNFGDDLSRGLPPGAGLLALKTH
jgi:hypothetical protein